MVLGVALFSIFGFSIKLNGFLKPRREALVL